MAIACASLDSVVPIKAFMTTPLVMNAPATTRAAMAPP